MSESAPRNARSEPEPSPALTFCKRCGDPIGDRQEKNGEWCGGCFDKTPCGMGKHGEGCPTLMVCEALA
jgi:hypothetical protein